MNILPNRSTRPWRGVFCGLLLSLPMLACSGEEGASAGAAQPGEVSAEKMEPEAPTGDFRMTIQDVFKITGRGTVVTGQVASGTVAVGQSICIERQEGGSLTVRVEGIEQFRKLMERASAGDRVGLMLSDIEKDDVAVGDLLLAEC